MNLLTLLRLSRLRTRLFGLTLGLLSGGVLTTTVTAGPNVVAVTDEDFYSRDLAKEALGRLLFFDKLLSGNKDIACSTCHHPLTSIGDGLSLPVGAGGAGLGPSREMGSREAGIPRRVPRHAPALFNVGARDFTVLFHDGRLFPDASQPSGFRTTDVAVLPAGLENVLAAQALLPLVSVLEMAGIQGQNPVADAIFAGNIETAWNLLLSRLRANGEYVDLFKAAFPEIHLASDIRIAHVGNAIAAFEAAAFRCTNSTFDRFARGDSSVGSPKAVKGGLLFYGKAGCSRCHSGPFQTDHQFHSIGMPQIGPGRGHNQDGYFDGLDDFGRAEVTGDEADRFKFRTPSLRQVALTGPWGHDGAYNDLEAMVRHHLRPWHSLANYDTSQAVLPSRPDLDALDFLVQADAERREGIAASIELAHVALTDEEVSDLMEFLYALTDYGCVDLRHLIPERVPSGLPVYD